MYVRKIQMQNQIKANLLQFVAITIYKLYRPFINLHQEVFEYHLIARILYFEDERNWECLFVWHLLSELQFLTWKWSSRLEKESMQISDDVI
jgi:hypothetical protein